MIVDKYESAIYQGLYPQLKWIYTIQAMLVLQLCDHTYGVQVYAHILAIETNNNYTCNHLYMYICL